MNRGRNRQAPHPGGWRLRSALLPRASLYWLLGKAAGAARLAARMLERVKVSITSEELLQIEQSRRIRRVMRHHDMVEQRDEAYYRDRYWEWIEGELETRRVSLSDHFLDAGCGSGRLTEPLAMKVAPQGGRVLAVDFIDESVRAARQHLSAAGLNNVTVETSDLSEFLRTQPNETFAGALFIEVALALLDLRGVMEELRRVLRPGGLLLASFRPVYYLAMTGVARRDWELTRAALSARSGRLPGLGWQNWHSATDAAELLEGNGFVDVSLQALGQFSGIEGDPLSAIARPSSMPPADLAGLAGVEETFATSHPDTGRYLLASAIRAS